MICLTIFHKMDRSPQDTTSFFWTILKRLSGPSVQQPKPKAQPRPNLRPNLKGSGYFIKYRPPYRPVSLPFPSALTQVSRTRTGGFLLSPFSFLPPFASIGCAGSWPIRSDPPVVSRWCSSARMVIILAFAD